MYVYICVYVIICCGKIVAPIGNIIAISNEKTGSRWYFT